MKLHCYKNEEGMWAAHMRDPQTYEQIGPEVVTDDPEISVFELGFIYGMQQHELDQSPFVITILGG
jgi:hypothetical protein